MVVEFEAIECRGARIHMVSTSCIDQSKSIPKLLFIYLFYIFFMSLQKISGIFVL